MHFKFVCYGMATENIFRLELGFKLSFKPKLNLNHKIRF